MTTSVTVKVYPTANWDAEVLAHDVMPDGARSVRETLLATVVPGTQYEAHATDTRSIVVREKAHAPKKS